MAVKKENIFDRYETPPEFWDAPIKTIVDKFKTKPSLSKEELLQEGYEKDYGKIDKEWSFKDKLFGENLDYSEYDKRKYLEAMSGLMEQGPSRGGTASGQFIMDQMDIQHKKGQAEKIKKDKEIKDKLEEEKRIAEAKAALLDSPKGRLQTLWADADKREAILGGIQDAMTEVKFGEEAYQSRLYDTQKKVRQNLKMAEATKIARQKAALDMMKVAAETQKIANPAQYMTSSQKEAHDIIANRGLRPGTKEYQEAYATQLQQIVVKDLTSAKAGAISELFTYAQALKSTDPATAKIFMDAIKEIGFYLAGTPGDTGKSRTSEEIIKVTDTTTTAPGT